MPPKPFFPTGLESSTLEAADSTADALELLPPEEIWRARQARRPDDPAYAADLKKTTKRLQDTRTGLKTQARKLERTARVEEFADDPEIERLANARRGAPMATTTAGTTEANTGAVPDVDAGLVDVAKAGGRGVVKALDFLVHRGRALTYPGAGWYDFEEARDPAAWRERVKEAAAEVRPATPEKPHKYSTPTVVASNLAKGVADLVGAVPGAAGGAVAAGLGAAADTVGPTIGAGVGLGWDLARGQAPNLDKAAERIRGTKLPELENIGKTVAGGIETGQDVALESLPDPLTYLGSRVNPGLAAFREARRAGKTAQQARQLQLAVEGVMAQRGGQVSAFPAVEALFKAEGMDAAKTFGKVGEHLNRGQLTVGIPGTRAEVNPLSIGGEYRGGKALQSVASPALKAIGYNDGVTPGRRTLFDPAKEQLEGVLRKARGGKAIDEAEWTGELDAIFKDAPLEKARREELIRRFVDPDFEPHSLGQVRPGQKPPLPRWAKAGSRIVIQDGEAFVVSPSAKAQGPVAPLTAEEQKFVGGMKEWFGRRRADLEAAGVLEPGQSASNWLTGQFYPRRAATKGGLMVSPDPNIRTSGKGSLAKARLGEGGMPIGAWEGNPLGDFVRLTTDPAEVLPAYARQAAQEKARKAAEDWLVYAFGRSEANVPGKGWGANWTKLGDAYVPTDLRNMITGTFDNQMSTVANFLRSSPGFMSSPLGRGIAAGADVMNSLAGTWKRNVTTKRPGFHVLQWMNDVVQMMSHGWTPADMAQAQRVLTRAKAGDQAALNILREAHKQNMAAEGLTQLGPVGNGYLGKGRDTQRLEAVAREGARARGRAPAAGIGEKAVGLARKVDRAGENLAQAWRVRAELSMYLARKRLGDSSVQAAQRTMDALIDYGSPSWAVNVGKWFLPFGNFVMRAPGMAAKTFAKNPLAVQLAGRVPRQFEDQAAPEPPQKAAERGPYVKAGGAALEAGFGALDAAREFMGFDEEPSREGLGVSFLPRFNPFVEPFVPYEEAARFFTPEAIAPGVGGTLEPMLGQAGPFARPAIELGLLRGRDINTGEPLKFTNLFPEAVRPLARYAPSFFMGPMGQLATNRALYSLQGSEDNGAPINSIGYTRPYAIDSGDAFAATLQSQMLGIPSYISSDAQRFKNLMSQPKVREAQSELESQGLLEKDVRAKRRR